MPAPLYRTDLIELARPFEVWRPLNNGATSLWSNTKKKPALPVAEERPTLIYEPSKRTRAARTFEDQQGGMALTTQLALDDASIAAWKDRQANPDDYEPEVSSCEECGEAIVFDVTQSGTLTSWCPSGCWRDEGKLYEASRKTVRGAFGAPTPLKAARRFWSIGSVGALTTARRVANRVFVPAPLVAPLIRSVFWKEGRETGRSKYTNIIATAERGEPFIVPIPADVPANVLRSRIRTALTNSKRTMMGKWGVSQVKEGLRIGLIGTWKETEIE